MTPAVIPASPFQLVTSFTRELGELNDQQLLRRLATVEAVDGPRVRVEGREVVCWCSNDYLGLSQHPRVVAAAAQAAARWGVGARASRLLGGSTAAHAELEAALARWYGAEAAVVFASGYLANLGALAALAGPKDLILIDRLAHASLIDASRATGARLRVFRHNDAGHAADLLRRERLSRRRFIVIEGVFSMDGDRAPLAALCEAAEAEGAVVYLDDAHGAFVLGASGRGSPEAEGVAVERLLYVGTLGKALGAQGGFVIGPRPWIDVVINRARTFIYATALATPVAAAAREALAVLETDASLRAGLAERARRLQGGVAGVAARHSPAHLPEAERAGHIVPVIVGAPELALRVSEHLMARGHWAPAIRPPTVPRGTARLRLSVTALHTREQIDALSQALREALADP